MGKYLWDRQEGETPTWFARFEIYKELGPSRSFLPAYKIERRNRLVKKGKDPSRVDRVQSVPESWRKQIREHNWETRALAWDEHQRKIRLKELAQERDKVAEARRTTIRALQALMGKTITAAHGSGKPIDPKELKELAQAAATIFKESRLEYGDPTEIDQVNISDGSEHHTAESGGDNRLNPILDAARARRNRKTGSGGN